MNQSKDLLHAQSLPQPSTSDDPSRKDSQPRRKTATEMSSIDELTADGFLRSDMNKFHSRVIKTESKLLGSKEYIIEINISNIPPIVVGKTFDDFKAFYKALKLRFPNVDWPEFPSNYSILKRKVERKIVFNEILEKISSVAKLKDGYKKPLLGIFFAFFLDTDHVRKLQRQARKLNETRDRKISLNTSVAESEIEKTNDIIDFEKSIASFERRNGFFLHKKSVDLTNTFDPAKELDNSFPDSSLQFNGSFQSDLLRRDTSTDFMDREVKNNSFTQKSASLPTDANELINNASPKSYQEPTSGRGDDWKLLKTDGDISPELAFPDSPELGEISSRPKSDPVNNSDTADQSKGSKLDTTTGSVIENGISKGQKGYKRAQIKNGLKKIFKKPPKEKGHTRNKSDSVTENSTSMMQMSVSGRTSYANDRIRSYESDEELDAEYEEEYQEEETNQVEEEEESEEDEYLPRARARGVSNNNIKEIPNFGGDILMRLSSENKWNKYFARIIGSSIVLYKSMLDNSPIHYVPCFRCELHYVQCLQGDYLELWHPFDLDRFQISIDTKSKDTKTVRDLSTWFDQIKIASDKMAGLNFTRKYSPIGKFQIVVYGVTDVKGLPVNNNCHCYVRLNHTPYSLTTSKAIKSETMKWKQSFFIPICDTFFPINIDLVCVSSEGWITQNQKEEVICSGKILVADVISLKKDTILTVNLPLKYNDAKLKTLAKSLNVTESEIPQAKLEIRIKNLSSVNSFFAPPYGDYIEGVEMDPETYSKQYLKLSLSRAKRIFAYLAIQGKELSAIINFKYPLFSFVCFIIMTAFILMFDVLDAIPNIILWTTLLCIYKHPKVEEYVDSHTRRWFFTDDHLNPYYRHPRVQTIEEVDLKKMLNTEKWKYKLVDPDSLMTLFRKAKKSLVLLTIFMTKLTGFIEKAKNIITWQDPLRTMVFLGCSLIAYCVSSLISFRLVVLLGVWANFIKGLKYYEHKTIRNEEVSKNAVKLFLKDQNINPELTNRILTLDSWAGVPNFNTFQAKFVERMKHRLQLVLPEEVLAISKTPSGLVAMMTTCSKPLKLVATPEEEMFLKIYRKKATKFGVKNIFFFIMNVPSDYYRVINPKTITPANIVKE